MASPPSRLSWYLAQLKPNSHRVAERNLKRQSFETFIPFHLKTTRVRGQFKTVRAPLFPGYIFVRFDPARGLWRQINSTQGVARLVQFGTAPQVVPTALVEGLAQRCDGAGVLTPESTLTKGDVVSLTQGPFTDFVATVETLPDEKRVWVLLELMGRETRVAVSVDAVRTL